MAYAVHSINKSSMSNAVDKRYFLFIPNLLYVKKRSLPTFDTETQKATIVWVLYSIQQKKSIPFPKNICKKGKKIKMPIEKEDVIWYNIVCVNKGICL